MTTHIDKCLVPICLYMGLTASPNKKWDKKRADWKNFILVVLIQLGREGYQSIGCEGIRVQSDKNLICTQTLLLLLRYYEL